jgi:uncharacterized membrane protein
MSWFVFQGSIVFAVLASNVAYEWTPNKVLAGLIAFGAAMLATKLLNGLRSLRH